MRAIGGGHPVGGAGGTGTDVDSIFGGKSARENDWFTGGVDGLGPVLGGVRFGEEKFSVGAIEDVEEAVAIGVKEKFARLAVEIGVQEDGDFGGVPIVEIERSELEIPLEFAGVRVEGDDGIGIEICARAFGAVVGGSGIAGGPVKKIKLGIVGAGDPGGSAATGRGIGAGPGVAAGFAGGGDGVEAPSALAGGNVLGVDETADAVFAAGDTDDDFVFDDERSDSEGVALGVVGGLNIP